MKRMTVNGKEIKTNLGGNRNGDYPLMSGAGTMGATYYKQSGETDKEMVERLANEGYKRITLYEITTSVRGYHRLCAVCYR